MDILDDVIDHELKRAQGSRRESRIRLLPPEPEGNRVPTLEPGVFAEISTMVAARFARMGRWEWATHGHWLSLADMEELWASDPQDELIREIKDCQVTNERNCPDDAAALFKSCRLSLFAGGSTNNERIYLLWLDLKIEPEVWVYESSGLARYADLDDYLTAYLDQDLSAFERGWEAQPRSG